MEENKKVPDQQENVPNQTVVISDNILCKVAEMEEKTENSESGKKNIYEKLMEMRVDFTTTGIKKREK